MPEPRPLLFEWDEWKFQSYFYFCYKRELKRLQGLTHKANIALALATCEWIEERFLPFNADPTLKSYIAAGWAAMIDRSFSEWFQLIDDDWVGPVRAPIMAAIGIINEAFFEAADKSRSGLQSCYAINLARHVLPTTEVFGDWLEASVRRLERFHSWAAEGPVEQDILAPEFYQGSLVARELLVESILCPA